MCETIHALLYFDIDGTVIVSQVFEVVEFEEIGREVAEFHVHILWLVHECVEVEILQTDGAVACILFEMKLLRWSLTVIMSTVGVLQFLG